MSRLISISRFWVVAPALVIPVAMVAAVVTVAGQLVACGDGGSDSGIKTSAVTACLRTTACNIKPYPRLSNCLDAYTGLVQENGLIAVLDGIYRCTNSAADCDAVRVCNGTGSSCDKKYKASCDGGKAVFCDLTDDRVYSYDCGSAGLTCQVDATYAFSATCVGGQSSTATLSSVVDCTSDSCEQTGESCNTDKLDECDGQDLRSCIDGQWVRFKCSVLGMGVCESVVVVNGTYGRCSSVTTSL
jgi:hypothetical protein